MTRVVGVTSIPAVGGRRQRPWASDKRVRCVNSVEWPVRRSNQAQVSQSGLEAIISDSFPPC